MLLQRLATGATGARSGEGLHGAARHSYAHAQYIHSLELYEGPWHLLFNVRQRMVYTNSAEGFAL